MNTYAATATSNLTVDSTALQAMEKKIHELPLLPQVLVKILQLNPNSDDYFEQFEKLANEDPPFAVRVVALANCAASAPAVPILSIHDAITRMGAGRISSFVASLAVQQVFMPSKPSQVRLWSHSIVVAIATQQMARMQPELKIDPGLAYLAGLLHDIGRFVMLQHASDNLLKVDESNWDTPEDLIVADVEVYKYTHSELGYLACKRWELPEIVGDIVRRHHDPISGKHPGNPADAIISRIQIADRLCMALIEDPKLDEMTSEVREKIIFRQCIKADSDKKSFPVTELCSRVNAIVADSQDVMAGLGLRY